MVSRPSLGDHRRMTKRNQIDTIVSRHHADESEDDRVCRACGRPWPCDVARIVAAFEAERRSASAIASASRRASRRATPGRVALHA
jgi:hypothetical protein